MTAPCILITEQLRSMPNGDRDRELHNCSCVTVSLVGHGQNVEVARFDQWDAWWSSIQGTRLDVLKKAAHIAVRLKAVLGADTEIRSVVDDQRKET